MSYYDSDATDKAARLYYRGLERRGLLAHADQINRADSGLEGDTVFLRVRGEVVARYRVLGTGGLRRLTPLPSR